MIDTRVREMHASLCDQLICVKDNARAIDAFRLMAEKHINGLAVVNNDGCLVDVISARDVTLLSLLFCLACFTYLG
jgi:predicted transcriptional regulator